MRYALILSSSAAFLSAPTLASEDMTLVWQDDFDGPLNKASWHIVEGNGCPDHCGFGNNELQTYTGDNSNLRTEGGMLVIEAHKANEGFTSAKITTQPLGGWQYGKISMRAKLPSGVGTWPAFWMMPMSSTYGSWPKSGEIDIMEHVGYNQNHVHGTIHTEAYNHRIGAQKGGETLIETASDEFHTYSVEWDKNGMKWTIDGAEYYAFAREDGATSAEWPFDQPFYAILNFAVGGDWGGAKGVDESAFPARYEIDWVKVWQKVSSPSR
ncbi:family 16 glycosylhydrolase [Kordiimonas sp.]|uniref:glycoside hydrolase family 16 protein n=1 Tax=Kordiimonas sp. TaxID=1970157 RepID=UPI003A8E5788